MKNISNIIKKEPYSIRKILKDKYFLKEQKFITEHHKKNCSNYKKIIDKTTTSKIFHLNKLPYISVNLFKEIDLQSIKINKSFKTLTSSGTTGKKSKIVLDKKTAFLQQESLLKISKDFIGDQRLPMIIVDNEKILKDKKKFSARAAAILGFSIFGKEKCFILNEDFELDEKKLNLFLDKYKKEKIIIFGFTFQIWKNFIINKKSKVNNECIVLHGGGWKKMKDISVSNQIFKNEIKKKLIQLILSIIMEWLNKLGQYLWSAMRDISIVRI